MRRSLGLLILLLAAPAFAVEEPASQAEVRMARELQARAWGSPRLGVGAERGELALALAELGLAASVGGSAAENLGAQDYDALFALLQRYRDDLLKLGLANSELEAQLKTLKLRSEELKQRLDKLKPRDGLKVQGRIYSFFDDMHAVGNSPRVGPLGSVAKPMGQGLRVQTGAAHGEIKLTATRGLLSGYAQIDVVAPWGLRTVDLQSRRIYVEMRLPVAMQFGDLDVRISPLTFWRHDIYEPFEPEIFAARRQRLRDDMLLQPDKWLVQGGRASTDILLFSSLPLLLESTTYIAGLKDVSLYLRSETNLNPANDSKTLAMRYSTYGEAWRAGVKLFDALTLTSNGSLFWDETATRAGGLYRPMNSLATSGEADFKKGLFRAGAEYALSSYTHPYPVSWTSTSLYPLTGTAVTYHAGLESPNGHAKVFGRMVSANYHAAAAQGRTIDDAYAFLGPFAIENSQVNAQGGIGLVPGVLPLNYATRINNVLIPPGSLDSGLLSVTHTGGLGNPWEHLLDYGPNEVIDPYGAATPDRMGFGAEVDWKFFDGGIRPIASYESFKHSNDAVRDRLGNTTPAFSMSRMRAGIAFDLKPMLGWPVRLSGGYTMNDSRNGAKNALGKEYGLASTVMDSGVSWDFIETMGLDFGYRHMDISGFNERFVIGFPKGLAHDMLGYGLRWSPVEVVRFDALYSQLFITAPELPAANMEVDQAVVRMTVQF